MPIVSYINLIVSYINLISNKLIYNLYELRRAQQVKV